MPNYEKVIRKALPDALQPGEQHVATLFALPEGGVKGAAIAGGISHADPLGDLSYDVAQAGAANERAERAKQDGATIGGTFPLTYVFITLTDQRLIVFDRGAVNGRKPTSVLAEHPKDVLVGMETAGSKMNRKLTLSFSDGSEITLDGGMGQKFDDFSDAIGG